jgi:hypothetical protein
MKTITVIPALVLSIAVVSRAESTNKPPPSITNFDTAVIAGSVVTETVSNLFVVFRHEEPRAPTTVFLSDTPVRFGFSSTSNMYYDIFMLRPEYGYRVFAKSENGERLEATRLGARYGEKFGEIRGYDKDTLDFSRRRGDRHPDRERPYYVGKAAQGFSGLPRSLPAPEELFRFNKPGKYIMWIEMQVLCCPSGRGAAGDIYLVKFPPVGLQVIKKENE